MLIRTAQFQSSALFRIGTLLDDGVQLQGRESSGSSIASQGHGARRAIHASCGKASATGESIIKQYQLEVVSPPEGTRSRRFFEVSRTLHAQRLGRSLRYREQSVQQASDYLHQLRSSSTLAM